MSSTPVDNQSEIIENEDMGKILEDIRGIEEFEERPFAQNEDIPDQYFSVTGAKKYLENQSGNNQELYPETQEMAESWGIGEWSKLESALNYGREEELVSKELFETDTQENGGRPALYSFRD